MRIHIVLSIAVLMMVFLPSAAVLAATLSLSPSTGVYTVGALFTARVVVNTQGAAINATEGTITFNPSELSVVSVDRGSSIFNLWVTEPTFSNTAGTITFSGGAPSGYTGSSGTVFTITFRSKTAQSAKVNITNGAVLANDGRGSNVLSSMGGGTYTISPASTSPVPEVIEYVAPANTPGLPVLSSDTHKDQSLWSNNDTAILSWSLPSGITAVRTLLDTNPTSIPTRVYDEPIRTITLDNLDEGVSYFHLQFQNEEGWGRVAHYRLAVDTVPPEEFVAQRAEDVDVSNPVQALTAAFKDGTSPVVKYMVRVNNNEPFEYLDTNNTKRITLPSLPPGYHTVLVEAFDAAGNMSVTSISFTIESFEAPQFTDYPREVSEDVIPLIKGTTRPNAVVESTIQKLGAEAVTYTSTADNNGVFMIIPNGTFTTGVYEVTAIAKDPSGAQSASSVSIKIAVQQPGYIVLGRTAVSVLSILVSLAALFFLLVVVAIVTRRQYRKFRRSVSLEAHEVVEIVAQQFNTLRSELAQAETAAKESRKTKKLTKSEVALFALLNEQLNTSESKIRKEAVDVEKLT